MPRRMLKKREEAGAGVGRPRAIWGSRTILLCEKPYYDQEKKKGKTSATDDAASRALSFYYATGERESENCEGTRLIVRGKR